MFRFAENITSISLPNLGRHQQKSNNQEPFLKEKSPSKKSSEKLHSEVKTSRPRKVKIVFKGKALLEINTPDPVVQQNTIVCPPNSSEQQQQLPLGFKNYMKKLGATGDPVLVIQKKLFSSDVKTGLQRFSIPVKQVVNHGFLTEEERSRFNNDNKQEEIDAMLIEPSLAQSRIKFKKWYMDNSEIYVLVSGWNEVVKRNGLERGQLVQLWSFKKGSQFYFALVRLW